MKFTQYGTSIPLVFREQGSSRNSGGSPRAGALNEGGVRKFGDFRTLSRHISETVHALSFGTKINDLDSLSDP